MRYCEVKNGKILFGYTRATYTLSEVVRMLKKGRRVYLEDMAPADNVEQAKRISEMYFGQQ